MSRLILPNRFSQQPQGQSAAPGYTVAAGRYLVDSVTGMRPTVTGSPVRKISKNGTVWNFSTNGSFANYLSYPSSGVIDNLFASGPATFHILINTGNTGVSQGYAGKRNGSGGGWGLLNFGGTNIFFRKYGSSTDGTVSATITLATNTEYLISIVQYDSTFPLAASQYAMYVNGVAQSLSLSNAGGGTNGTDAGSIFTVGSVESWLDMVGDVSFFAGCRRAQSPAEVLEVARNPWGVFKRPVFYAGAPTPDLTFALSGNSGTSAVGTAVTSRTVSSTGTSATSSVGTITPVALVTGNAAAAAVGSIIVGSALAVTGNAGTTATGTASPGISKGVTGTAGTGAVGTVDSSLVVLTGNAASCAVGNVLPSVSRGVTGVGGTATTGAAAVSYSIGVTGASAVGTAGTFPSGAALTGIGATSAVGAVSPVTAITGALGTSATGPVTYSASTALVGNAGANTAGAVLPNISSGLVNASTAGAAGTLAPGLSAGVSGLSSTSAVGAWVPSRQLALPSIGVTYGAGVLAPVLSKGITGASTGVAVGVVAPVTAVAGIGTLAALGALANTHTIPSSGVGAKGGIGAPAAYNPTSIRAPSVEVQITQQAEEVFSETDADAGFQSVNKRARLTGNAATGDIGDIGDMDPVIGIVGNAAIGVAGRPVASGVSNPTLGITGNIGTSAVSAMTASGTNNMAVGITGNAAASHVGAFIASTPTLRISGVASQGIVGSMAAAGSGAGVALNGNAATGTTGTMRASNPTIGLTGNQAVGNTGLVTAPNTGINITTISIANTTGATVPGGFITQMFGHQFRQGDIPVGFRPRFELTNSVECPHTMLLDSAWPDGSLKTASFFALVPTIVAGNGSINLVIKATQAPQAASARTLADLSSGGTDIRMSVVGLDNIAGQWDSSLTLGAAGSDVQMIGDGPVGKVWKIHQPFMQGGLPHGQLQALWYVMALQDANGSLYGLRYLARVWQPWYNVDTPTKIYKSFSSMLVKNGATIVRDCYANHAVPKSFTYASGSTVNCPAHKLETGTLVRLSGGIPAGVSAGMSYFLGIPTPDSLAFANTPNNTTSGYLPLSGGATSASLTAYPYLTQFGSLWSAGASGMYDFVQAGGSATADATVRVIKNNRYMVSTGTVTSHDLSVVPTAQALYAYEPNSMGPIQRDNSGTGERPDIGLIPTWDVRHILTGNAVDEQAVRVTGLMLAHAPIALYNNTTKNIPIVNNKTYAGLPAGNQNMRWFGGPNTGGFTSPTGPVTATGLYVMAFDHMPCLGFYPYMMTGEPQFLDLMVEMMNMAVMHRYPVGATANNAQLGSSRNGICNGTTYSGFTVGDGYALREDAWSSRDVGLANGVMPTNPPQGAGVKAYAADLMDATYSILLDYINNVATPFFRTSGMMHFRTATYAQNSDNWMHGYWVTQNAQVASLTRNPKALAVLNHAVTWFNTQYAIANSAWHLPCYRTITRVADLPNAPYITSTAQLANYGASVSWVASGSLFTGAIPANGNGWVPANGDKFMWETEFGSTVPAGMSQFVPYYAVNTVGRTFQLALSPGGAPITLSDSGSAGVCMISANPPALYGQEGGSGYQLGYLANILGANKIAKAAGCSTYSQALIDDLETRAIGTAYNTDPKCRFADRYNQ